MQVLERLFLIRQRNADELLLHAINTELDTAIRAARDRTFFHMQTPQRTDVFLNATTITHAPGCIEILIIDDNRTFFWTQLLQHLYADSKKYRYWAAFSTSTVSVFKKTLSNNRSRKTENVGHTIHFISIPHEGASSQGADKKLSAEFVFITANPYGPALNRAPPSTTTSISHHYNNMIVL
jgi:hypothetical protein